MATLDELIGESRPRVELRRRVDNLLGKVAGLRALPPILIRGETGTGKTTLARLIHRASARVDGPFVDVNCAEFQEALLESQLFGHERHTFTGAGPGRTGLFQAAHRGVLLLDEISEMSIGLQAKLLKVLDDGAMRVRRLGATRLEAVDVAVIAATHADLRTAVAEGRFRRDLYSRLTGFTLQVPALRQRFGDIELLAEHFLARACEQYGLVPKLLGDDARAALRAYEWPGNVRELANVIRRAALESESSTVTAGDLDLDVDGPAPSQAGGEDLPQRLLEALTRTSWNITHTAAALGLTRKTVRERIRRYGLESRRPQGAAGASTARDAVERTNPAEAGPSREPASAARHAPGGSPLPNPVVAVRWTRRRITLLRARVGYDAALPLAVTTRVLQTVIEQVQGFHGRIESLSPHGMVAVFGLEPDEDAPRRAAYAALAIVRSREPGVGDELLLAGLSIAVGLHMTSMLIADVAGTVTLDEDAKTDAWRTLEDLTGGSSADGVALSDSAAQSLGRRFEIVRHAEAGRVAARLVGPGSSDVRFGPSEFLGRQRELALLEGLLERAIEGRGQVALIAGEPGIGKSRLVYEFTERQTPEEHALLVGQCVSYGTQVPYHLTLDMLRHVCGLQDTDQPDAIVTKTHAVLERMGAAKARWAPYVLNLLCPGGDPAVSEAPPEIVREKTFEALLQLVMLQQERQPLILVVEDLHWIDPVSEELLGTIAAGAVGQRVLLLCTVRPGYQVPWITRSHATQIALPPLSAETSRHLVQSALGGQLVAEDVVKTILARGEGNPFFLEELVRVLRDGDARSRVGIPATIHDVLSARILRLPEEDRHIFQVAAVIGRDVPLALLETVLGLPPDLVRAGLTRLQSAEFLYPVRVGADAAHTFSHALTWDVANELLLEEERRALHVAVVAGIERCYAARLSDHVERLADHAEQGRRWDAAVEFCRQAGHKAIAHSAYREAVSYFTRALTALEHLPPDPVVLRQGIDVRFDLRTALVP